MTKSHKEGGDSLPVTENERDGDSLWKNSPWRGRLWENIPTDVKNVHACVRACERERGRGEERERDSWPKKREDRLTWLEQNIDFYFNGIDIINWKVMKKNCNNWIWENLLLRNIRILCASEPTKILTE